MIIKLQLKIDYEKIHSTIFFSSIFLKMNIQKNSLDKK